MNLSSRSKLFLAAALLLAVVAGAFSVLLVAYHSYENSPSPYPTSLPEVQATSPVSGRVVIMVSDGLRADLAGEMKNIGALARRPDASYYVARTEVPSLSEPGWTAIMTGAGPLISGVRSNAYSGSPVPVESLFQSARRAGIKTAVAGAANEWGELFRDQIDEVYLAPFPTKKGAAGDLDSDPLVARAMTSSAKLMLLYYPAVDDASHYHGTFSDEAVKAMLGFDGRVGEVASRLDFERDTLIVTSDHGHVDAGGHGGYEEVSRESPLLMVGKGIAKSTTQVISQLDIAPTVSVLLGIGRPRDAEGMPLVNSIDADPELKAVAIAIHGEALRRRLAANYEIISGQPAPNASTEVLADKVNSASWQRAVWEGIARVPVAIAIIALLVLIVHLTGGLKAKVVGGALVCLGFAALAVWSAGFTWSISYFNESGDEVGLLLSIIGATLAGMAVSGLIAGNRTTSGAWQQAMSVSAFIFLICGFSASILMVYYGPTTGWRMPDLRFSWAMFIIPTIVALGSVAGIPLAAGTAAFAHKISSKSLEDCEHETELKAEEQSRPRA